MRVHAALEAAVRRQPCTTPHALAALAGRAPAACVHWCLKLPSSLGSSPRQAGASMGLAQDGSGASSSRAPPPPPPPSPAPPPEQRWAAVPAAPAARKPAGPPSFMEVLQQRQWRSAPSRLLMLMVGGPVAEAWVGRCSSAAARCAPAHPCPLRPPSPHMCLSRHGTWMDSCSAGTWWPYLSTPLSPPTLLWCWRPGPGCCATGATQPRPGCAPPCAAARWGWARCRCWCSAGWATHRRPAQHAVPPPVHLWRPSHGPAGPALAAAPGVSAREMAAPGSCGLRRHELR